MSAFTNVPRPFKIIGDSTRTINACLKIQIGNLELSVVTDINGNNQAIVYAKDVEVCTKYFTDFNELVSFFWSVEKLGNTEE